MKLPFLSEGRQKKLRNIFSAIRFVHAIEPTTAKFEAFFFISDAFLVIYQITLFGRFLDETVAYIKTVETFSLRGYLGSNSFLFFLQLAALWLVTNLFVAVKDYLNSRLEVRFWGEIYTKIIEKIGTLNLEDVERAEFQDLLNKVINYSIPRLLDTYWRSRQVIYQLTGIATAAFFVFQINALLPLGAFLLVLPEILYKYLAKKAERSFINSSVDQSKYADSFYYKAINLRNFAELKVNGIFSYFLEARRRTLRRLNEGVSERRFDQYIKGFSLAVFDQFLFRLLLIGLVAVAILRRLTAGTLQALFRYMVSLYDASLGLWDRLSIIGDNSQYVGDYFDFVNLTGFSDMSLGDRTLGDPVPEIKVVDLTFDYLGRGEPVLKNVNLTIRPGDKVALIGADGSGKSSLFKVLCGLYQIRKGDVFFEGTSIRDLGRGELKNKISALFEDFVKYDLSIRENITLAAGGVFNAELYKRVLEVTLLDQWLEDSKLLDSQILGRLFGAGTEISNGHWQRIAIARTLYRDRPILMMDEPLVFVDTPNREQVLKNIVDFVGDRTLLMTFHGLEEVKFFKRVLLVGEGTVRELELNAADQNHNV